MPLLKKEVWTRDIAENLIPDNSFVTRRINDDAFVTEGAKTVNLAESGALPATQKNRTTLPAPVAQRVDVHASYDIDEFTTDPVLLTNVEELQVNYAKRQNVLRDHVEALNTQLAQEALFKWAASSATYIVRTTGATGRAGYRATQTGNRKPVVKDDIINMARLFDRMDIPMEGRVCLVDADLYADLRKISEFTDGEKYGQSNIASGVISRAFSFDFMMRSSSQVYDNTGTPVKKAIGAAAAGTDNLSLVAWHPNFVRGAIGAPGNGGIKVFFKEEDPTVYGSIFSALVLGGFKTRYTDGRGVVSLVEAAV